MNIPDHVTIHYFRLLEQVLSYLVASGCVPASFHAATKDDPLRPCKDPFANLLRAIYAHGRTGGVERDTSPHTALIPWAQSMLAVQIPERLADASHAIKF